MPSECEFTKHVRTMASQASLRTDLGKAGLLQKVAGLHGLLLCLQLCQKPLFHHGTEQFTTFACSVISM